jgi:hypothetical protein
MAGNGRRKGDDALVLALASGQTVRDAACAAGVGERTATRRWADPDFRRRVARRRAELAARAAGRLPVSLVAEVGGAVVGHLAFSPVTAASGAAGGMPRARSDQEAEEGGPARQKSPVPGSPPARVARALRLAAGIEYAMNRTLPSAKPKNAPPSWALQKWKKSQKFDGVPRNGPQSASAHGQVPTPV